MKKYLFILLLLSGAFTTVAQKLELINGLYYKQGMLYTGTYTEHYNNGNLLIKQNISNGLEHGEVELFFESGAKQEYREFNQGKKTGEWYIWDISGVKIAQASYKDNLKDGTWYLWNSNGVKIYEMHYSMGVKTGEWTQWDDNGNVVMQRSY